MLAPDVHMTGLDGRHLAGWLELLLPPGAMGAARVALVFVDRGQRVRKSVVIGAGSVEPGTVPFSGISPAAMDALRRAMKVDVAVVIEGDALARLFAGVESTLRLDDDYPAQGIAMWRAFKKILGKGIWIEPRLLDVVPVVSADALQRTFDLLIPDGTSMLAYVIDDDRAVCTATVIATKRAGHIDRVATHLAIEDVVSERSFARSWRSQTKRVLGAVEERFAPASLAVFIDRRTYRRILTGPTDLLGRELAARNVIIDPAPAWLSGLLGGAAAVAAATGAARALARFVPSSARRAAAGLAAAAQDRLKDSGVHPFSLLGFDPIDLWLRVRHIYKAGG